MILDLRVYTLVHGSRAAFQQHFEQQILPMLDRFGIRVVCAAPSLHDADSFCLIRAFASVEAREQQLDAFYGSEEWLTRHDAEVMALIDNYSTCVIEADEAAVGALTEGLRR